MKKVKLFLVSLVTLVTLSLSSCSNGWDVKITTPQEDAKRIALEVKEAMDKNDLKKLEEYDGFIEEMTQEYLTKRGGDQCREFIRLLGEEISINF
jgi:hypothetical protein